ncbi:MAG TPA: redoxin domain-containing protein [Gaiellaceae bacterium]|nr:redoxin domain-containing protein [Gaiellaceae bacterium]
MSRRNRERRERNRQAKLAPAPRARRPLVRYAAVAAGVAALVAASFVLPRFFEDAPSAAEHRAELRGDGPDVGVAAPAFAEINVMTGEPISTETIAGRRTLLFFSEGVMCQACFVQIRDLEQVGERLAERGIDLVSITPDPLDVLRQAVRQYAITTPVIADDDRDMSAAFDTLGQGMHPDMPGHAFVLVDETGTVVWQRDYWLEPWRTMYVEPERLLKDIPTA